MATKRKMKITNQDRAIAATRWANGIGNMQGAEIVWLKGSELWRSSYRGLTDYFGSLNDAIKHLVQVDIVWRGSRNDDTEIG